MPKKKRGARRNPSTSRGLYRVAAYLHEDELLAVEREAKRHRCSQSEIIRRVIRQYFKIED